MTRFLSDLLDLLSGVQGERVPGQADLQVGVAELSLTGFIKEDLVAIITGHGVQDHAVVTRRHHDHTNRSEEHPEDRKQETGHMTRYRLHFVLSQLSLSSSQSQTTNESFSSNVC